jgi:uncharacterized repeat protein (TIGR01451 family)
MKKMLITILFASVVYLAGCCCKKEQARQMEEPPAATAPAVSENPCAAAAIAKNAQSYPISNLGGAIRLEKMLPEHVNINAPFEYRMNVTNLTDQELTNVVVSDYIPAELAIENSTPEMQKIKDGFVAWNLGKLEPKGSRTISMQATAKSTGSLSTCASVSYDCSACAKINVVEPKLELTKQAPSEILACDRIPLKYVIRNTGSGAACDITIEEKLQAGLQTAEGGKTISFKLESLAAGESKEFEAMVDATKPGTYSGKATASASNLVAVESGVTNTVVNKPVLAIESTAPSEQYLGRTLSYNITVKNTGNGMAENAVLVTSVPENVKFMSATEGGNFTHMSPGKVTWNIGALAPNASKTVRMELSSDQPGEVSTTATANAKCAEAVTSSSQIKVAGIAAILLEVIDSPDPIEIGQNVTYTVKVTNQGSAADTAIRINCMLEKGMEYVTSDGPTKATVDGGKISFEALPSLAPKGNVEWKIIVKASDAGDMRFKATMNSEQLGRPVEETESTKFYK